LCQLHKDWINGMGGVIMHDDPRPHYGRITRIERLK